MLGKRETDFYDLIERKRQSQDYFSIDLAIFFARLNALSCASLL